MKKILLPLAVLMALCGVASSQPAIQGPISYAGAGSGSGGGGGSAPGGATNTTQYNAGAGAFGGVGPGTTNTLLHGNASGPPAFSSVDLAADVTGNLSVSNLNSGTSAGATTFWRGDGTWATPSGTGTVTTITGGNGILPSTNPCVSTCTLNTTVTTNVQTGASYAMASTDGGKVVTASNGSSQAYTIVQANTAGFVTGYGSTIANIGAGTVTLTATTSTFGNGLTSVVVAPGQVLDFASDGTNYPFTALSLPKMAIDTVLGNFSGTSNYPISGALTSCSAATSAVSYNTTSHAFGCNTVGLGTVTSVTGNAGLTGTVTTTGNIGIAALLADGILQNATGGSAVPTAVAIPSCSAGSSALTYNTSTHAWGCNTISSGTITVNTTTITSGTGNRLVFDNAGTFGEISQLTSVSGALTLTTAGAASTPAVTLSGAPFTGGSGTTTFPLFYLNSGTAPTNFSTNGTVLGINAPSGFTGDLVNFEVNGTPIFSINGSSTLVQAGGINVTSGSASTVNGIQLQSANTPCIYANSSCKVSFGTANTTFNQNPIGSTAGSFLLQTTASSSTAPTISPNRAGTTTGIGAQASGNMSMIVQGVEKGRWTTEGLQYKQATAPTVTGTGSPTIATGSTDEAGEVTSGTTATSIVITFNLSHTNAPFCVVTPQSTLVSFAYTLSNTAITVTQTATSSEKIDYRCSFP